MYNYLNVTVLNEGRILDEKKKVTTHCLSQTGIKTRLFTSKIIKWIKM